jgi:hypothetical protein
VDGNENEPVRLRIFRDEAQDFVPLDFGPLFAAAGESATTIGAVVRAADLPADRRSTE